jgi:hypothetical protein
MLNINTIQNPVAVKESQPRVLSSTGLSDGKGISFMGAMLEAARTGKIVIANETMAHQAGLKEENFDWVAEVPKHEETIYDFLQKVERILKQVNLK